MNTTYCFVIVVMTLGLTKLFRHALYFAIPVGGKGKGKGVDIFFP